MVRPPQVGADAAGAPSKKSGSGANSVLLGLLIVAVAVLVAWCLGATLPALAGLRRVF